MSPYLKKINILKENLSRARAAHHLAFAAAAKNYVDLLSISCRNKNVGIIGFFKLDAALRLPFQNLKLLLLHNV